MFVPGIYIFVKFIETYIKTNCRLSFDGNDRNRNRDTYTLDIKFNHIAMRRYIWSSFQFMRGLNSNDVKGVDEINKNLRTYLQTSISQYAAPAPAPAPAPNYVVNPLYIDVQIDPKQHVYVPKQHATAAIHQKLDIYDAIKADVDKWEAKYSGITYGQVKNTQAGISLDYLDYTDFRTKVTQCMRMMFYCNKENFDGLCQFVEKVIKLPLVYKDEYLHRLRVEFYKLKRQVLDEYQPNARGGYYKYQGEYQGKIKDTYKDYQEALDIVNEHFILGYKTPPNKNIWNLVNTNMGLQLIPIEDPEPGITWPSQFPG
jgi:hypothetical protein